VNEGGHTAVRAVFLCPQHGKSFMDGPCVGAFGHAGPSSGTPTRTVPSTQIGVWGRLTYRNEGFNIMLNQSLTRLNNLHAHFSQLRGADSALLKANGFNQQLDELATVITHLGGLSKLTYQLMNVSGALELLLELFDAAHNRKLDGGHLHCLLEPLQDRLDKVINAFDEIL
jgi:hypothetical protein